MGKAKITKTSAGSQTVYDRCLEWFKNKVLVVIVLLMAVLYSGVSELIKSTRENRENLFGKEGLLTKNTTLDTLKFQKSDAADKIRPLSFKVRDPCYVTGKRNGHSRPPVVDTIFLKRIDTIFIDTLKAHNIVKKYFFRLDSLVEGQTFVDPLTSSSIAIFSIQPCFEAKAILNYPNGFYTLSADTPEQIKVRPGQSWDDIIYEQKRFKMTIQDINYPKKLFSISISEVDD
jgi:hypothetical protein